VEVAARGLEVLEQTKVSQPSAREHDPNKNYCSPIRESERGS